MQQRRYLVLVCQKCSSKNVVRQDAIKAKDKNYLCNLCAAKQRNEQKFQKALGEASSLIKDSHVQGKHRYVLVDCASCSQGYWARLDNWEAGRQRCWPCAHPNKQSHGKTNTELHKRWMGIIKRINSDKPGHYRTYKGRGITMCDEWRRDFLSFERWALENGYKKDLLLDRIDNYKGYSPENCRWVTPKQSTNNRRKAVYI